MSSSTSSLHKTLLLLYSCASILAIRQCGASSCLSQFQFIDISQNKETMQIVSLQHCEELGEVIENCWNAFSRTLIHWKSRTHSHLWLWNVLNNGPIFKAHTNIHAKLEKFDWQSLNCWESNFQPNKSSWVDDFFSVCNEHSDSTRRLALHR